MTKADTDQMRHWQRRGVDDNKKPKQPTKTDADVKIKRPRLIPSQPVDIPKT